MADGDATPVTDPIIRQVSQEYTDANGNTIVIGYAPNVTIIYDGMPGETGMPVGDEPEPPTDEPS